MNKRIYLDYAATNPIDPRVLEAISPYLKEKFGNPSSLHSFGQEVRKGIEKAREQIADLIGAEQDEIIFTSGGTEANNLVIKGVAGLYDQGSIVISAIEHHSVLDSAKSLKNKFEIKIIPVDKNGVINLDYFKKVIDSKTRLISIMRANNETGVIQPIEEVIKIAKKNNILFHTDAVQSIGYEDLNVKKLKVDFLTISAHKIYGLKGTGALFIRRGLKIKPLFDGGLQERKIRPGTENIIGIIGFGKAAEILKQEREINIEKVKLLRDYFEEKIKKEIKNIRINGEKAERLPNISNITFFGVDAESLLLLLDQESIAVSLGAACSAGSLEPSHVLLAMGLSRDQARSSIRFSFGKYNKKEEIDLVIETIKKIIFKIKN